MAGYSGTPLPKKLGIKEGHQVAVVHGPEGFERTLGVPTQGKAPLDVIVAFFTRRGDLEKQLAALRKRMAPACGLWIAWPKKASGVPTDITEDVIRAVALPTGLVDNKVCAIDEVWSGLRLVIRLANRLPGRP